MNDAARRRRIPVRAAVAGVRRRGAARVGLRPPLHEPAAAGGVPALVDRGDHQPQRALHDLHLAGRARGPLAAVGALPGRLLAGVAVVAVDADGRRPRRPGRRGRDDRAAVLARRRAAGWTTSRGRCWSASSATAPTTSSCPPTGRSVRSCRRGRPTPATPRPRRETRRSAGTSDPGSLQPAGRPWWRRPDPGGRRTMTSPPQTPWQPYGWPAPAPPAPPPASQQPRTGLRAAIAVAVTLALVAAAGAGLAVGALARPRLDHVGSDRRGDLGHRAAQAHRLRRGRPGAGVPRCAPGAGPRRRRVRGPAR